MTARRCRSLVGSSAALALLAPAAFAQTSPPPPPPQAGAFTPYIAPLQKLQAAGDWRGLEQAAGGALADITAKEGADSVDAALALSWLAGAHQQQGNLAAAEGEFRRALTIAQAKQGEADPVTANAEVNLAELLLAGKRPAEAEPLERRALASFEAARGPGGPPTVSAMNGLRRSLEAQGKTAEAQALLARLQAVDETTKGADQATASVLVTVAQQFWATPKTAEPLARHALAIGEKTMPAGSVNIAFLDWTLGGVYQNEGRARDAEPLQTRGLEIDEKVLGPDHPSTGAAQFSLGLTLQLEGRYAEAETLFRKADAAYEKAFGPGDMRVAMALVSVASVLQGQGRNAEAEPIVRRAVTIAEKALPAGSPLVSGPLFGLATILRAEGKIDEAESILRRDVAILSAADPDSLLTASAIEGLAALLEDQGRYAEAEPLMRRMVDIDTRVAGPNSLAAAIGESDLGMLLQYEGRPRDAETPLRASVAIETSLEGDSNPMVTGPMRFLAGALRMQGKFAEAEALYRKVLTINQQGLGPDNPSTAAAEVDLGQLLEWEGRSADAVPLYRQGLAAHEKTQGADASKTNDTRLVLGAALLTLGQPAEASSLLRTACGFEVGGLASARSEVADTGAQHRDNLTFCASRLTTALWSWSEKGGGATASDRPLALKSESFDWAQRAVGSSAGEAMSRSGALAAAALGGAGSMALDYEAALVRRDTLDGAFAKATGGSSPDSQAAARNIAAQREAAVAEIHRLETDLQTRYPLYWDYRSPSPLGVDRLQAMSGADAALLGPNEAVVLWMTAPGADKGLVFAISKRGFAWARMAMSEAEIAALVRSLRAKLDPLGAVGGAVSGQDLAAAGQGSGGMTQGGSAQGPAPPAHAGFDRAGAWRLYQALLGDEAIQTVIHGPGIDTLLIVPSGALTSLPPAVLVTSPPQGRDDDPAALSATHWLIAEDAIAVLPQVSALKTLRQLLPAAKNPAGGSASAPSRPLLAFADPDFAGAGQVPGVFPGRDPYVLDSGQTQSHADRGAPPAAAAERDGRSRSQVLAELPPLWDTRREGLELMGLLHADHADLLLGPAATKTALMQRQADHSLAGVKVLDFSTHGLITGDFAGLTEPALVLAAPPAGTDPARDDQLLRASEAAGLTLTADWVVLSACNTAAGDTPGAEGLSGLARAFFHAGAKSLLVSHWRVDDAATERLIATTFATYQAGALTKAKALQQAMTAMIKDPAASNPSLWGPFVIVGEPR